MEPKVSLSLKVGEKAVILFLSSIVCCSYVGPSVPSPFSGPPTFLMTSVGTSMEAGLLPGGRASYVPL